MKSILLISIFLHLLSFSLMAQGILRTPDGKILTTTGGKILKSPIIGDLFGGGILAYIFQPGDPGYVSGEFHGLIASPSDLGEAIWGCFTTVTTNASGREIGTGRQNTNTIIATCTTSGIAAKICADLVLNGYDDWFLPSINELVKLYENRIAIGGFSLSLYWSSSEYYGDSLAAAYNFNSHYINWSCPKWEAYRVRAIRYF